MSVDAEDKAKKPAKTHCCLLQLQNDGKELRRRRGQRKNKNKKKSKKTRSDRRRSRR